MTTSCEQAQDDPAWQAAHRRYLEPQAPTEFADEVLSRRIRASLDMWKIESKYEAAST